MKPILFASTAQTFTTHGIGTLSDAISCLVTEERNGEFELTMVYPVSGIHYESIGQRSILLAKPNPTSEDQAFRVYRITKPLNGQVTVYARHISYDLSGVVVLPFTATSAAEAFSRFAAYSVGDHPFTFWTDKQTHGEFAIPSPVSLRSVLGGSNGSLIDVFGGEYEWDNLTVKLHEHRGEDRGVTIRYGKNLTDLTQEENCASCYTAVLPFWKKEDTVVTPDEPISAGTFDYTRIMVLDFSNAYETAPTARQLTFDAQDYVATHQIGVPKVSLKVSFVQLEQTTEYKDMALLERVSLCDTVKVEFEKLGVSAEAKVIKTVYDCLLDRYDSVELGDSRTNISDTIASQQSEIEAAPGKALSLVGSAIDDATRRITGNLGGYVVLHSSVGGKEPDEILIMDTPDILSATKVWRWNCSGLGYSSNGYNGPYRLAMTAAGEFVADFITTGTLAANIVTACAITAGFIQNSDGTFRINLDDGNMVITGSQTFTRSDYSSADQTRVQKITIGAIMPTAQDIAKYDITGEGSLNITDVVQVSMFVNGQHTSMKVNWIITLSAEGGFKVEKETIVDGVSKGRCTVLSTAAGGVETTSLIATYGSIGNLFAQSATINGGIGAPADGISSAWSISQTGRGSFSSLQIGGEEAVTRELIGYLAIGKPSGGSMSTCFVPVGYYGSSNRFQIADETAYVSFYLYSDGDYQIVSASASSYSFGPVIPIYNY